MQVEQEFFVGIQDVGINYEMTNKAFFEAFSNISNIHGNLVGQGISFQEKNHMAWVVSSWKLEVYQRPKVCEFILVKTWAQEYSGIKAYRDYEITNQNGDIIAKATSAWIAVNTKTGKPIKLTDDIIVVYGCEPQHKNFPGFKFTKAVNMDFPIISQVRFKINRSLIDCNNHVHNPSYMDLVNEVLPEGMNDIYFNNIEVNYKKEITLHEDVLLEYTTDGNKNYVFIWDKNRCTLYTTIIMF